MKQGKPEVEFVAHVVVTEPATEIPTIEIFKLQDDVAQIEILLNRLNFMQQEVVEEYFDKYQPNKNEDDRFSVCWEHERYGVFSNIVQQLIHDTEKVLKQLKIKVDLK